MLARPNYYFINTKSVTNTIAQQCYNCGTEYHHTITPIATPSDDEDRQRLHGYNIKVCFCPKCHTVPEMYHTPIHRELLHTEAHKLLLAEVLKIYVVLNYHEPNEHVFPKELPCISGLNTQNHGLVDTIRVIVQHLKTHKFSTITEWMKAQDYLKKVRQTMNYETDYLVEHNGRTITNTANAQCKCGTKYHSTYTKLENPIGRIDGTKIRFCPKCLEIPKIDHCHAMRGDQLSAEQIVLLSEIGRVYTLLNFDCVTAYDNPMILIQKLPVVVGLESDYMGFVETIVNIATFLKARNHSEITEWLSIYDYLQRWKCSEIPIASSKSNEPAQLNLKISKKDLSNPKGINITITPIESK